MNPSLYLKILFPVTINYTYGFLKKYLISPDNCFLLAAAMLPKFWNEQKFSSAQCIVGLNNWPNAAAGLLSPVLLICFLFQLAPLPDLIPALTAAEQRAAASLKWRTHEKLLQKYACLPHIISSDQIYYRFLQRMFTIVLTNVSPIPFILSFWMHAWFWN